MRPHFISLPLLASLFLAAAPLIAGPSPDVSGGFELVRQDYRAGILDRETYLLESFRLAFAPERSDLRYASLEPNLPHCFTPTVTEYVEAKATLSPEAAREIEGYLTPRLLSSYVSPSGLFEMHFDVTGVNAVPTEDVNPANGVPDFVERCAEYCDESWNVQITTLGFFAPALPGDGTYDIFFVALGTGLFGFTEGQVGGTSEITIDNNFTGAGHVPSDDPDGAQLGRAKGVITHEFKHASQWTNSGSSAQGWKELDANWVIDVVFDTSNIYLAWCNSSFYNSNLTAPWVRMDDFEGTGSYEDLLWQTYLSETYGNQIIVDLWDIIRDNPGQDMKASYRDAMTLYGTNWTDSYASYLEWSWFSGSRAEPPFGFEEAETLLRMRLREPNIESYPFSTSDNVDRLAAHPRRFNPGTANGLPRVVFNGDNGHAGFVVSVIAEEPDGSFTIVRPTLDANNDFDHLVTFPWASLAYTGVIVTNTKRSGDTVPYTLQVIDEPAIGVAEGAAVAVPRLALGPGRPNPFDSVTRLHYTIPGPSRGSVRIYDVSGRIVRRLLEEGEGEGEVFWDARNDDGERVPSGVYWSRVETREGSVARKLTLLR